MSGQAFEKLIMNVAEDQKIFCHRIKTRMSGFANDNEPGDFIIAGHGMTVLLEAKSTQEASFSYSMLRPNQFVGLYKTTEYDDSVRGGVIVEMRRTGGIFYLPIEKIQKDLTKGYLSIDLTNLQEYAIIKRANGDIDLHEFLKGLKGESNE